MRQMRALIPLEQPSGQRTARLGHWWTRYLRNLKLTGPGLQNESPQITELAQSVQDTISLLPDPDDWGETDSPYKGLVVGSVQSGKTTNMIGVTAAAIDQGFRIIVVLAGRTEDLRRQTSLRFNMKLMERSDEIPETGGLTTLGTALGQGPMGGFSLPYTMDAANFSTLLPAMRDTLSKEEPKEPCVLVIKKEKKNLTHVGDKILRPLYEQFGAHALPTLVLDDECDEASVPGPGESKEIPELIVGLWRHLGQEAPHVAYVGYTATAAASLLQDPELDLYPQHFAQLLRHPSNHDTALTYEVVNADDRYSGSFCFYEQFGDTPSDEDNFLICPLVGEQEDGRPPLESDSLFESVVAYFVAGAYRLALNPSAEFNDPNNLPLAHTMIVQPSSQQIDHGRFADAIRERFFGEERDQGVVRFDWARVEPLFAGDEDRWHAWYKRFESSRDKILDKAAHRPSVPAALATWADVRTRLADAVNNTKLRVVNSDPEKGTSLAFARPHGPNGTLGIPEDIYTIAVGGAVLSRGLTIEGLCISYYTRDVDRPLEDATMQMSRWLGYRGEHLEFCRLFTTVAAYHRLKAFHDNDQQHRARLAVMMENHEQVDKARIALRTLPTALLTSKIGIGRKHDIAFSPYTHVFSKVEIRELASANQELALRLVEQIRSRCGREERVGEGQARGLISRGWLASEVADFLDSWSLSDHNPDPADYPHKDHHRPPDQTRTVIRSNDPRNDPYLVAAYLRWWATNPVDSPPPPTFNVGVTYGPLRNDTAPFSFPLLNRAITEDGHLQGGWGGDDKFMDGPASELIDAAGDRVGGANGLLLLHVVHAKALGRGRAGHERTCHTISFGIAVPHGGNAFSVVVNYDRR